MAAETGSSGAPAPATLLSRVTVDRGTAIRAIVVAAFVLAALFAVPALTNAYWELVLLTAGIYTIVALGLALLIGRVGLISLGQIALFAVAGWIALRLGFATHMSFPLLVLVTGLITTVVGVLIGLPALRLSGLYLALITLMFAAAITLALAATQFPNGGSGFLGYSVNTTANAALARPGFAASDAAYYRLVIVVGGLMFLLAGLHVRSRAGRAWAAIRQSEAAAMAAGVNITLYKLWALALASFMTGVAGALLVASGGGLTVFQFPTQNSIILAAVVLMGGVYTFWGPIVAGLLFQFLPALLRTWGLPSDLLTILFGIGVLQVQLQAPSGIAVQLPRDLASLGRLLWRLLRRGPSPRQQDLE
ncbi:MAG: branched-chain amino acid ABC transporter permease [Candidatus Dormibacteraeota bacterium]|nr:branched-chain amino acid ABC transporter permease [Candidatus Dormibacteraeota bacterium]MBO0760173.1 branched-chain amino acid ABC transporter permease [Candidatus Dormibacteraeota bacterium]